MSAVSSKLDGMKIAKSLKVPQALKSLKLETAIVYAVVVLTAFAAGGIVLRYSDKGTQAQNTAKPATPRSGHEPEAKNTVKPATPRSEHEAKNTVKPATPRSGRRPDAKNTVKRGTYPMDRLIHGDSSTLITLDRIQVTADNKLTAHIVYQNVAQNPMPYTCRGYDNPAIDTLTLANGRTLHSEQTYCSTKPNASWTVAANQKFTSFATFTIPKNVPEPITFNWYADYAGPAHAHIDGSVKNITLIGADD